MGGIVGDMLTGVRGAGGVAGGVVDTVGALLSGLGVEVALGLLGDDHGVLVLVSGHYE